MGFPWIQWLSTLLAVASAIWVYSDAKKFKDAGVEIMSPGGWAAVVFFFWIIAFPLYLIKRGQYSKQMGVGIPQQPPQEQQPPQ